VNFKKLSPCHPYVIKQKFIKTPQIVPSKPLKKSLITLEILSM